ncbi:MAG: radical SAM protein [Elusimicrobiota bacterium]
MKTLQDRTLTTYSGKPIPPPVFGLPKEIDSVCPDCSTVIKALLYAEAGKVWIRKSCPEHGEFKDIFFGDEALYLRCESLWFGDGRGVSNPAVRGSAACPMGCGLCEMHASPSGLPILDLTNRCDLNCPMCFANAGSRGPVYEPTLDQVTRMLEGLKAQKPVPADRVQFSGGEPTLRPDFLDIVRKAVELDFFYIQVNTNGLRMADFSFAQAAKEAGVETLYMQFDGMSDDVYRKTRGRPLLDAKLAAIENCRKLGMCVILAPTVIRGVNDHEVGAIARFAARNYDVVRGVTYQPVAFIGRYSHSYRLQRRYTLSDLAFDLESQAGMIQPMRDWLPVGVSVAFSRLAEAMSGKSRFNISLHPHCSQGCYLYVCEDGSTLPYSAFVDLDSLLRDIARLARTLKPSGFGPLSKVKVLYTLQKHFNREKAPKGLTFEGLLQTMEGWQEKKFRRAFAGKEGRKRSYRHFYLSGMHFMDGYNFSLERLRRCVIHYPSPDGRLYPFCAYNGIPGHRRSVEERFHA